MLTAVVTRYMILVDGEERPFTILPTSVVKCETPAMKRCVVCSQQVKLENAMVLPCCAHVFCLRCPKYLHGIPSCISCQVADPTVEDLKKLIYIQDLRDPPEALLQAVLEEYMCAQTKQVVESIATKHKNEVQVLENEKTLAARKSKDKMCILKDTLGKAKTQKQLKEALRNSHPYKAAKDELDA